jgi:predicted anti-sigma-YlaC factor YlaD
MTEVPMNCEQALRLLAEHLDGELAAEHAVEVEGHLARCRSCYSRAEFERRLKGEFATLGRVPLRPELEARVQRIAADFRTS